MAVSKICEKQIALNSATLILQKPLFSHKNTKLCKFYVLTISLLPVFKIAS